MPELPEVESYRALAETRALGRTIVDVRAPDAWYLKGGLDAAGATGLLVGRQLLRARRRGKLLLLDVSSPTGDGAVAPAEAGDNGAVAPAEAGEDGAVAPAEAGDNGAVAPAEAGEDGAVALAEAGDNGAVAPAEAGEGAVLGLRFGMSGRLVVDLEAGVGDLLYTTRRHNPLHDRFAVVFDDGGELVMHDPRRLGGVILDPHEERLGPDARTLTLGQLRTALAGGSGPLKARLMDQARVAGIGNLLADEILWRAALSPLRPAGGLDAAELRRLRTHVVRSVEAAIQHGGSHTGEFIAARQRGGHCPKDKAELSRDVVGGRTTYWCPAHQH